MHERGAPPTGWHRSPRPPGAELRGLEHNLTLASLGVRLLRDTFLTPGWAQAPFGCSGADLCDPNPDPHVLHPPVFLLGTGSRERTSHLPLVPLPLLPRLPAASLPSAAQPPAACCWRTRRGPEPRKWLKKKGKKRKSGC